jgi:hypothetical protein
MVKTVGKVSGNLETYNVKLFMFLGTLQYNFCRPRINRTTLFYFNGNLGPAYEGGRPEDTYVSIYLCARVCMSEHVTKFVF